jgi:Lrp/AsnC family leucine-responsive transcriptional regulator
MLCATNTTETTIGERMAPKKPISGKTRRSDAEGDEPHGSTLDRYDVAILRELQADARLTNTELASRIGLSAAPTWRRVKWLEDAGLHHRLPGRTRPPQDRPGRAGLRARGRRAQQRRRHAALEDAIRALPEVVSCHYISGTGTFELHVVATDLDAYSRWAMDKLFTLPNVKDLHTSFSLGDVKSARRLPLRHLDANAA